MEWTFLEFEPQWVHSHPLNPVCLAPGHELIKQRYNLDRITPVTSGSLIVSNTQGV